MEVTALGILGACVHGMPHSQLDSECSPFFALK